MRYFIRRSDSDEDGAMLNVNVTIAVRRPTPVEQLFTLVANGKPEWYSCQIQRGTAVSEIRTRAQFGHRLQIGERLYLTPLSHLNVTGLHGICIDGLYRHE